ncbi:MAG TPA: PQQ-binding-like beta-propeller repeat protein [Thermomicrobiales bacterium]|nr:PQQ-binding-like beta-propeller repeat protein [Thermomicrobiales bacterium]
MNTMDDGRSGWLRYGITRRNVLLAGGAFALGARGVLAQGAATPMPAVSNPVPSSAALQWPLYGHDLTGGRATDAAGIDTGTVADLGPLWQVEIGGAVSATPVISDGTVFIGSYVGTLDAIDLQTGGVLWTYDTGAAVEEPNLKIPLGITGSAAVDSGVVYLGDAAATVHAIDQETGTAIWKTVVDDQPQASIWSSPMIAGGTVFVGVASVAKEVGFRGSVVALDATDGTVRWQTFMVPEGADGAGVFAVPAIDEARGMLYVGTQNAYTANPAPYGNPVSIVALDIASGDVAWAFNAPPGGGDSAPTDDVAFSASPNLFTVEIDGASRDLVGEGQKSGDYWALDRDTGEVVWQAMVSPAGFLGGMEGTSAASAGVIAVPATNWPDFNGPAKGMVTALDAASGEVIWTVDQDAPAASPVAISGDLVFHAGMDGILHAYVLTSGEEVWSYDLDASVSGGIAVADGIIVLGAATPQIASFVKPGNMIRAFGLQTVPISATPEVATPVPAPATPPVVPATPEPSAPATPPPGTPTPTPPEATPIATPVGGTPVV